MDMVLHCTYGVRGTALLAENEAVAACASNLRPGEAEFSGATGGTWRGEVTDSGKGVQQTCRRGGQKFAQPGESPECTGCNCQDGRVEGVGVVQVCSEIAHVRSPDGRAAG